MNDLRSLVVKFNPLFLVAQLQGLTNQLVHLFILVERPVPCKTEVLRIEPEVHEHRGIGIIRTPRSKAKLEIPSVDLVSKRGIGHQLKLQRDADVGEIALENGSNLFPFWPGARNR